MRPTQNNLKKIEELLSNLGYKVRYGKGNFQAGACTIHENNVIVVNKFLDLEIKIQKLLELLDTSQFDTQFLEPTAMKFYNSLTINRLA